LRVAGNSKIERRLSRQLTAEIIPITSPRTYVNDLRQKSFDAVYAETNPNTAWNQLKCLP